MKVPPKKEGKCQQVSVVHAIYRPSMKVSPKRLRNF